MPYPETCPECAGPFRNTGTHFTARRQELGRHVLLELGCQNSSRRYWWDFTQGKLAGGDGRNPTDRELAAAATPTAASQASVAKASTNGHVVELPTPRAAAPVVEEPPTQPEAEPETRPGASGADHASCSPGTGSPRAGAHARARRTSGAGRLRAARPVSPRLARLSCASSSSTASRCARCAAG